MFIEEIQKRFNELKESQDLGNINQASIETTLNKYSDLLMNEVIQCVSVPYNLNHWDKEIAKLREWEQTEDIEKQIKDIEYEKTKIEEKAKFFEENIEFLNSVIYIVKQING